MTAGVAWLFDPKQGSSRRAKLQEQLKGMTGQLSERRSGPPSSPGSAPVPASVNGMSTRPSDLSMSDAGTPSSPADRPPAEGGDVSFDEMSSGTDALSQTSIPDRPGSSFDEPAAPPTEIGDLP